MLSDDEKRSIYDRFGEAGLSGQGAGAGVSLAAFYCLVLSIIILVAQNSLEWFDATCWNSS